MNLQTLRNAYRTETNEGTLLDRRLELTRPGPAGAIRELWYLIVQGDDGKLGEYQNGFSFPFYRGPDINQMDKGDKIRTKLVKILGVPVYLKVERGDNRER